MPTIFKNEPFTDFSKPENRKAQADALTAARAKMGQEYPLIIGGKEIKTEGKIRSLNPANHQEVIGVFQKGTSELAVQALENHREPHLILRGAGQGFAATVGCNGMRGSYETLGAELRFGPVASTRMACPPPLDRLERQLGQVLRDARRSSVFRQTLELFDQAGRSLLLAEAVYLP